MDRSLKLISPTGYNSLIEFVDLSKDKEEKELATNQLSSFLKVALFNAQQASLEQ